MKQDVQKLNRTICHSNACAVNVDRYEKNISFQLEGALKAPFCKIEKSSHFLYSVQKTQKHNEQVSIF